MARGDQSLMGRLFRRKSAVEGESTDDAHAGERDVLSAQAASSDDSAGDVPSDGTSDYGSSEGDANDGATNEGSDDSAVIGADGSDSDFTFSDGSSEGDVSNDSGTDEGSDDSAVIGADGSDSDFTVSDGSAEGDVSNDSGTEEGSDPAPEEPAGTGDAGVDGSESDAPVLTGDDTDIGEPIDPDAPVREAGGPSAGDLGLGSDTDASGVRFDPRSELAKQIHDIEKATEPQLDPEVVQARLGGLGPQPPEPRGPLDDTPDELAFGKGALQPDANLGDVTTSDLEAVDDGTDPVAANPPDDGLDPVGHALSDTGIDPVGGAPPDDGLGQHEVRIDDTTDHSEPTEVDID